MRFDELGNTIVILCNKYGKYQKRIFLIGIFCVMFGLLSILSILFVKNPYTITAGFGIHKMNYHRRDKIYCYGKMIQILKVYDSSKNPKVFQNYHFSLDSSKYIILKMKFSNHNSEMIDFQIPNDFMISDGEHEVPFGYGDLHFLPDDLELDSKQSITGYISATVDLNFKPKYVYYHCYDQSNHNIQKIRISL